MTTKRRREAPALAEAFERLVRRYRSEIFRTVFRLSRNREDAEDLTQITFLNAYTALQRGAQPDAPRAWLHAIARNAGSRNFRQRRIVEVELDEETSARYDEEVTTVVELQAALAQLTLNQRAALLMREVGGLSAREIAARLGISPGAVATLLFRARRALRAELEGEPQRSPLLGGVAAASTALRSAWLRLLGPACDGSEVLSRSAAAVGVAAAAASVAFVTTSAVPHPARADHAGVAPAAVHVQAAVRVAHVRHVPASPVSLPVDVRGAAHVAAAVVATTRSHRHATAVKVAPQVRASAPPAAPSEPAPAEQKAPEHVAAPTTDATAAQAPAEPPPAAPVEEPAPAPQPVERAQALVTSASQSLPSPGAVTSAVPSSPTTALPQQTPVPPPVEVPVVTPPPTPPVEPPALPPPPPGILPSG